MARKVRLTDEAFSQIEAISAYIAIDSPLNSLRWLEKLQLRIEALVASPEMHAVLYTKAEVGFEVRQTFYGVYRILYSIDDELVHILTVRHGAREPTGPDELTR